MRIGVRCHDVIHSNLEELSEKVGEKNLKGVQLAIKKIKTGVDMNKAHITPGMAKNFRDAFVKNNVSISVLGCYINLAHPDDAELNKLLDYFKEHIRFARDFGCSIVGTETGALNREYVYGPENNTEEAFQRTLNSVKVLVEEAEKFGVIVGIEAVTKHVINTPERTKRILDSIKSNNLQVIFDPVNLLDENNYKNQDEIIKKSFELFGDRIVIIHAKDFVIEDNQAKVVPIGKGLLNYQLVISLIKERNPYIDILLENSTAEDIDESINYISNLYN
ncbi:sugar phosphate isomerase/epimerase family protein [Clostridium sp.]|uniref:sugar phosphate isomerase/epimerase family protein n=1 Tax=Clostridium sp. TaxID=1506 RepID=UPI002849544D|nr:sugar phosphate isomerase/epimerase family protein [Clostridium sp.]MDR3595307.1 sugar phosphate isomerase/epimerase [Clostridium sp.]